MAISGLQYTFLAAETEMSTTEANDALPANPQPFFLEVGRTGNLS